MKVRSNYFDTDGIFIIKPYKMKDLCAIYGISSITLRRWMQPLALELGKRKGHFYSVQQIEVLVKHFGLPRKVVEIDLEAA